MKKNREKSYVTKESKQIKKVQRSNDLFEALTLFGGITCAFAIVAALMGGAAELTANLTMNEKAQEVYASEAFQSATKEKLDKLSDELVAGKISIEEYNAACDALYSPESIINFSKTAGDKDLTGFVESYNESKDLAEKTFTKGLPIFAGTTAIAAVGAGMAHSTAKKRKKELDEITAEAQPEA